MTEKNIKYTKLTKRSLQEALKYADNILSTIREPLLILDPELCIVSASRSFYTMFSVTPQETEGKLIYEVGNGQWNIPKLRELLEEILPKNTSFDNFEVNHEFPNLGRRTMLLNARRIYGGGGGKTQNILLAIEDITERKRLEQDMVSSETRYRRLFETAQDGVLLLDAGTGEITDVNPFLLKMLEYSKQELIGKKLWEIGFFKDVALSREAFQILQDKGYIRYENLPLKTKNGQPMQMEFVSNVYPIDGEKVIQCNIRDITERKKTEEKLKQRTDELEVTNSELESFSYSVSHDLKAPLLRMEGFSNVLLEDYAGKLDEQGKQYLKYIVESSDLMARLIDDLLKLSQVVKTELNFSEINLSGIAWNIISELKSTDSSRKVQFSVVPDIIVSGDYNLMLIALRNLLGNAWKFTSKVDSPMIELGTLDNDGKKVYFVRDNGAGFDMKYADKLFRPFRRLHNSADFTGTGIGLATVWRIIRRHGGRVWAEGEPDKGATFYFTLD